VAVLNSIAPPSAAETVEEGANSSTLMLAPRSLDVCRIVIVLVLAYAILTKLV
jgi:hypothetical protein